MFSIMHSYFETQCKYLLFTKYLTSTNMPTAQQKKGHQINLKIVPTGQIREVLLYVIINSVRLYNKLTATFK